MRTASNLSRFFIFAALLILFVPVVRAQDDSAVLHHSFIKSKGFWFRMGLVGTAALGDTWSTEQGPHGEWTERNPLFDGGEPGWGRMIGEGAPFEFGIAYGSWRMSHARSPIVRKLSWAPIVVDLAAHVWAIDQNERFRSKYKN
jgi:hypothetical protein